MQKIEGDIKKRWLLLAAVNMLLLLLVFGALMVGFGFFSADADKKMLKDDMVSYADGLKAVPFEELKAACNSPEEAATFENPNFYFGIYTVRQDGSVGFSTGSAYLRREAPQLYGRADEISQEEIGGHYFMTYTTRLSESGEVYLKIFAATDAAVKSENYVALYSIPFILAFILIGVAISIVWGYIEIKPVMSNYYKQKSFINDMSHEIRTPLAIIKGNLENILASPDSKVRETSDMLEGCLKEVDYMTDITSGLLNIVRGENKSPKKDTELSDAVSEVVDLYSDVVAMSNKALIANIQRCDMHVDREKVKQLLTILLENSIKYTSDGDKINIKLKSTKDGCVLTVSDTGIGVSKGELELIFDRFYRAENTKDIPGTGLGLSIAKSITESLNGSIKAVQNIPQGLEIIVQLKRT